MKRSKVDSGNARKVVVSAVIVFTTMTSFVLSSGQAGAAGGSSQDIVPSEVAVEIRPGATIDAVNARNNTATKRAMNGTNFYLLKIPHGASANKWQTRLAADPDVIKAYFNPAVSSPLVLNGSRTLSFPSNHAKPGYVAADYLAQNGLDRLKLEQAHLLSQGKGVVVAVIDTGVDINHAALKSSLWTNDGEVPGDGIDND